MSATTTCEALPYPCLTDTFARHWIEDLATAADNALNRIQSDVDVVNKRGKAQMRRMNSNQTMTAGAFTTVTYDTTDYQPTPAWVNAATGVIVPTVPGLYFVDGRASRGSPSADAYILEIQYNAATVLSRKFDNSTGGGVGENYGVQGLVLVNMVGTNELRMRFEPITNASPVIRARFAAQLLVRCNPPLNANPYFEKDATNWSIITNVTSIARSTTQAYRGNASLLVTPSGTNWFIGSEHVNFGASVAGKIYLGTVYVRPASTMNMHLELAWYNSVDTLLSTSVGSTFSATGGVWNALNVRATAPANTQRVQLQVSGASNVVTHVDDAQFTLAC